MKHGLGYYALAAMALVAVEAAGQQEVTVQLPTFNMTTVRTTVTVPDGGTGLLGGIGRASEGSVSRGVPLLGKVPGVGRLFNNRGIGRDLGLSQMTVSPRVIILEEEELRQTGVSAETLSAWSASQPVPRSSLEPRGIDPAIARRADFLARHIARHPPEAQEQAVPPASTTLENVRRQNELARLQRAGEAEEYFVKGQRAEAEGKAAVAKIWYEMAGRRAEGELQQKVAARLAALAGSTGGDKLAGR
jgi:hypothetical protein